VQAPAPAPAPTQADDARRASPGTKPNPYR
jgi:hypothetical protein